MQGMTEHELIKEAQENFGESGIESTLDALEAYYLSGSYDEVSGDMEAPTGHFYRIHRWIVVTDSQGFRLVEQHYDEDAAKRQFETLDEEYSEWDDESTE